MNAAPTPSLVPILAVLAVVFTAAPRPAGASPDQPAAVGTDDVLSPASILADAGDALLAGEHQRAADLARGVLANPNVERLDRTEAWRLYGLASFFLERFDDAERAFLEYLKLDVDGRLDPALVPPEAIGFFEDVRARHASELRRYRPTPERRRYRVVNFLPPLGQFQNGHRTKGYVLAGLGTLALATNITTFAVLESWCDDSGVCKSGSGASRTNAARRLKTVNLSSALVLVGVFVYGVYDGFRYYRPNTAPGGERVGVELAPIQGGGYVGVWARF
ncbi:hypothetical protein [Haliangium sp.]|uniref:hypothetical protein n=1 Tax=Haliangium sp. TaxID=2663208 RepID=UPI003D11ECD6